MSDIIDLSAWRRKAEGPDATHVTTDQDGREMYRFMVDFQVGNSTFTTDIWAYSFEDAEHRVECMKQTLVVRGQLYSVMPGDLQ